MITYEYPFNERIRSLLRLEDLHERFKFFLQQEHPLEHQAAIATLFEILELVGRADLKLDLLQELERQKQTLIGFKSNPNVEEEKLDSILSDIASASANLAALQGRTGQSIRENEWLMSIRSRMVMPGGVCEFDIPSFFAWKNLPFEKRVKNLTIWFEPIKPLFGAVEMVLRLLRESGKSSSENAIAGNYQQMLQGKTYLMLRLTLEESLGIIPEISANKYMLWVRFATQESDQKPRRFENDVPFQLTLCNF